MSKGYPAVTALQMTPRQYDILETVRNMHKTSNQLVKRIEIILKGSKGQSNYSISKEIGLTVQTIRRWRRRWDEGYENLLIYEQGESGEGVSDKDLLEKMLALLKDHPRCGKPPIITLSQKQQIIALACRKPSDYDLPHTRWTYEMLAHIARTEKIVESISPRYVGEILKKS